MDTSRQQLLVDIDRDEVNRVLDTGGRIVYLHRLENGRYDAVFETYIEAEHSPEEIVLGFLATVPESLLEKKMAEEIDPEITVAKAALLALTSMVPGGTDATA